MNHIEILASVPDLEALLALQSVCEDDYAYDTGGSLVVRPGANVRTLHLRGDDGQVLDSPLIEVKTAGDNLRFRMLDSEQIPEKLWRILCAMGAGIGKQPLALGGDIDIEVAYQRRSALDATWCVMKRLALIGTVEADRLAQGKELFGLASAWSRARQIAFDKSGTPQGNANRFQREMDALGTRIQEFIKGQSLGIVSANLQEDPRGSAFTIKVTGYDFDVEVCGAALDWLVALHPRPTVAVPVPKRKVGAKTSSNRKVFDLRPTAVGEDVLAALQGAVIQGFTLKLVSQLSPKVYAKVNELMVELGGSWHTGAQAHVFQRDPAPLVEALLRTRSVLTSKDYEFFPTPSDLVKKMIKLALMQSGMKVLEPSAGRGAIACAVADVVGLEHVECCELMPANAEHLESLGFKVRRGDFLEVQPEPVMARVLLNPPFAAGRDMAHIHHAMRFLAPGGRLVAIASTTWRARDTKECRAFREWLAEMGADIIDIERGAFHESGTDVATTMLVIDAPGFAQRKDRPDRVEPMAARAPREQIALFG